jgi:hypothetical protein
MIGLRLHPESSLMGLESSTVVSTWRWEEVGKNSRNTSFENNNAVGPGYVVLKLACGRKIGLKWKGNLEDVEVVYVGASLVIDA